jgi:NTE family protein
MIQARQGGSRIGLACAGGVVEGAFYEIGALSALEEAVEGLDLTRLHAYVGVSAGAIIVSSLANGISVDEIRRAILAREDPALELRPEYLFTPAVGEYVRRAGSVPWILAGALRDYLSRPADLSLLGALSELKAALPVGLFDNAPLGRYMARVFSARGRSDDFRDLPAILRLVAVNLDTSELVAFGGPETAHVPISRAVQASTALPGLYCPVEIDGSWYIDGVARRTLNASSALDAGTDLLFCVNPIVPVDLRVGAAEGTRESLVDHGLPAVLSQTLRTLVHSRMRTAFRRYEHTHQDADLILLEPETEDPTLFFSNLFSFSSRYRVCEYAYRSTRAYLLREADRLRPVLHRHGLELRMEVLEDASRTLSPEGAEEAPAVGGAGAAEAHGAMDRLDRALDRLDVALR